MLLALPDLKVVPVRSALKTLSPVAEPMMVVMPEMLSLLVVVQAARRSTQTVPVGMLATTPHGSVVKSAVLLGPIPVNE